MGLEIDHTMFFNAGNAGKAMTKDVLKEVYRALEEKGYDPINQIVGYLISGDPAYITSHNNARSMIKQLERDELIEELVKSYLEV